MTILFSDSDTGVVYTLSDLVKERDDLILALQECITDSGAACYNTGKKTRRLEAINETAKAAIEKAEKSKAIWGKS